MTIKTKLLDGKGTGKELHITSENEALITSTQVPPVTDVSLIRPFRQYFTDDGTSTGSTDMRVDGSTTNVDFYISASIDGDRYIDTISIAIADTGATLNQFGNIGALTNGIEIFYEDASLGDVTIAEDLVSNFEFLRMCAGGVHGIGSGATSYKANNVQGNSEGYIMSLDFSEVFGLPYGIKIPKGTTLRLVTRIKDNVSGVDKFDIIAYGFDRIIND
jgi:hypothetical protein